MRLGPVHLSRLWRTASEAALALIGLAVLGAVLGPQWDPVPLDASLRVQQASTAIGDAPTLEHYATREHTITVQLDGTTVEARVVEPVDAPGARPGIVFVHGAGTGRVGAFPQQVRALAEAGVVVMVPAKRLDTYSTTHRDYLSMAADYGRSVDLLRTWPGVDPRRVGVYAESEGAWIAPVMAADDPQIAFVVLVSAPVVPPREQAAFAVDNYLRNTGVPSDLFRAIPRAVGLSVPGAFEYVDFDVSVYQQSMRQPVLVVYGTDDAAMPMVQGAQRILWDTASADNTQVTVRYYQGADHGLKVDGTVVAPFLHDLTEWVVGLPATASASPRIAGAQPVQQYRAGPVPTPRWLRDGTVMIAVVVAAVGALALAGLVGAARRVIFWVRRRRTGDGEEPRAGVVASVGRPLVVAGAGAVATVVTLVWYLMVVARLALDYQRDALVVTGGWAGVRLLGVATVLAAVLALREAVHAVRRSQPVVTGVSSRVAVGLSVVATSVLLVVLAYWGVFQLGI